MKINRELLYERLYDDPDVWASFVEYWIKTEPVDVFDAVDIFLSNRLNTRDMWIKDNFSEFVERETQRQLDAYVDDKYQEWKDDRITEPGGADGRTETEGS